MLCQLHILGTRAVESTALCFLNLATEQGACCDHNVFPCGDGMDEWLGSPEWLKQFCFPRRNVVFQVDSMDHIYRYNICVLVSIVCEFFDVVPNLPWALSGSIMPFGPPSSKKQYGLHHQNDYFKGLEKIFSDPPSLNMMTGMITQWLVVLSNGSGGRLSGTYSKCIWPNNIDLFSPFVNDWMTLEKCKSKSCVFHAVSQALDRGKCEYGPFIIPSLTQTDPRKAFTDPWSKNKVFFPECVSIEQIYF